MGRWVNITATGKTLLHSSDEPRLGRLLVHYPAGVTIENTFVGHPSDYAAFLDADDDVTLSYYTPNSDALAATAITMSGGASQQVHVKADGNDVFASVASLSSPPVRVFVDFIEET